MKEKKPIKLKSLLSLLLFISILIYGNSLSSQEKNEEDIKVGLVLSGGGAKGLAHIGALKVIEESGVRIDYIGGTSMGAIIGALYASGYTANELDSIFRETDFNKLIQDEIPRRAKSLSEKNESEKYVVTLPFDHFKLGLPSGISKGQNVYNLLSKLTNHVNDIRDFSELPIPFFCVATNVETGSEVILDKGYLPRAVVASGALPSLFNPVLIDDEVLVDGGVVNNYPIREVKAKGMDYIIGVDVQDSLKDRQELRSAFRILMQISNYRTINDMKVKRGETDIYIHPDIRGFSVVSFEDGKKIVKSGEDSAEPFKEEMENLAKRQKKTERKKIPFVSNDTIQINQIKIEGNKHYTRSYILGKMRMRPNSQVTYRAFGDGINSLAATNNFRSINYRFIGDQTEGADLVVNLDESPSRTSLRFALHYDDLFRTAALVNLTHKRFLTNNDVVSLDLIAGDNLRYNFDYYIDKGYYWSLGLNSRYHFFETEVPLEFLDFTFGETPLPLPLNKIGINYSDFTNQLYFQTLLKNSFVFGVGAEHKYLRFLSETIGIQDEEASKVIFESTNYFSTYGYLRYDNYDNLFFPTKGFFFSGDFNWYLWAKGRNKNFKPFSIAKAELGYAFSPFEHFSVHYKAQGGFTIGSGDTTPLGFALGGYGFKEMNNIIPFIGFKPTSLRGNSFVMSGLTFDYEFVRNNHLNFTVNIANVGDNIFDKGEWLKGIQYSGFALGYGLNTLFGPLEIKYAISPQNKRNEWHVALGYRF